MYSLLVLSTLFVGLVTITNATDFYITSPYNVVKWRAGESVKVTWNLLPGGGAITGINVDLMDGNDHDAHVIANIATGLSAQANSVPWNVPESLASSVGYFIRLTGVSDSPNYRFSHRFEIGGGAGAKPANNVAAPQPVAPAAPPPPRIPQAAPAPAVPVVPPAAQAQVTAASPNKADSNATSNKDSASVKPDSSEEAPSSEGIRVRPGPGVDSTSAAVGFSSMHAIVFAAVAMVAFALTL